jgi:phage N-6-adenine-methyltransferase
MGLIGRPFTYHLDQPATNVERQRRFRQKRADTLAALEARLARKVYHESIRTNVGTPWHVFNPYNDEFAFTMDVCASVANRKCAIYFSEADNGLEQDWGCEICWMNPPYGKYTLPPWMKKAYESSLTGATVVCLVPARTDTRWWHDWVQNKGEVRIRKGRTKFDGYENSAGFPCVAVIYRPAR